MIHHDLEKISLLARHYATEHRANYTVIILNTDENGEFDAANGSTYEFVADSYFEKERTNVKVLFRTDDDVKEIVEVKKSPFEVEKQFVVYDYKTTNPTAASTYRFSKPIFITDGESHNNPTKHFSTPILRTSPKIGRNDLCLCGSGLKHKNCKLKNAC